MYMYTCTGMCMYRYVGFKLGDMFEKVIFSVLFFVDSSKNHLGFL